MDIKNPNKIKFKENEDVRTSFKLKSKGVGADKLVVLTDRRIYLAGSNKSGFMKKSFGVFFANLDSIIAGERSKSKSTWPRIFMVLFAALAGLAFSSETLAQSSDQFLLFLWNNPGIYNNLTTIGMASGALFLLFLYISFIKTKKSIVLHYEGGKLHLPMNGKSDEEISSYLDIIADGIDG